jgi:hypothetical protein
MPNMVQGTRGGPGVSNLRQLNGPKQPYFKIAPGVSLRDFKPQSQLALDRVIAVFFKRGFPVILTSAWREKSLTFSLHLSGYAFDVDTDRSLPTPIWVELADAVRAELGEAFDVVAHDVGSGMHLHVEYDPKKDLEWQNVEKVAYFHQWKEGRVG